MRQTAGHGRNHGRTKGVLGISTARQSDSAGRQRRDWPQSPLDRFILAKLEAAELEPAVPVGKRQLIRRATFDLLGSASDGGRGRRICCR